MTAWYLPSGVPLGSVSESVAEVIGVWPGDVMIVSKGTPSRCRASCQETKSGSVVEVPSSSTFMSMRRAAEAEAAVLNPTVAKTDTRLSSRTIDLFSISTISFGQYIGSRSCWFGRLRCALGQIRGSSRSDGQLKVDLGGLGGGERAGYRLIAGLALNLK